MIYHYNRLRIKIYTISKGRIPLQDFPTNAGNIVTLKPFSIKF